MNSHVERARMLVDQGRFDLAEQELRQALGQEPENALAHGLLALCLGERKQEVEALQEARRTVHLAPDWSFSYYVLTRVALEFNRLDRAQEAAEQALRLDPQDADLYALLASVLTSKRKWREALEVVDRGLALDAEHVALANLRAMALTHLGRRHEAGLAVETALANEPDNEISHANMGWTLLHQGKHKQAMDHFREALRLDPNNEWARRGIVEALKARNILYRPLLTYFLWMSRLPPRVQFLLMLGAYFFMRLLRQVGRNNPEWQPYLFPVFVAYLVFVFLVWTADPLFNLLLRLHPLGRYALSRDQVLASNVVGLFILLGAGLVAAGGLIDRRTLWLGGFLSLAMIIPISGTFQAHGKGRAFLGVYTALLVALLGLGLLLPEAAATLPLGLVLLGIVLFTWIASFVFLAS